LTALFFYLHRLTAAAQCAITSLGNDKFGVAFFTDVSFAHFIGHVFIKPPRVNILASKA
jgi:hypothetical protein